MGERYYFRFLSEPGEIDGTGGMDMDDGWVQLDLKWPPFVDCNMAFWGCSGNAHHILRVDGLEDVDGLDPVPPVPIVPPGYSTGGWLYQDPDVTGTEIVHKSSCC